MTPERIEELADQCEASPVKRKAIVDALRQCAQEAANEALEKAASECDMNPSAILLTAGELSALGVVRDAIRALKGKPC